MTTDVLIKTEDLQKSFGNIEVLKGINTEIYKGEVVVVIGPSGSGKSTFLRTLNLLENPTAGKIFFEGTDITDPQININKHRQKALSHIAKQRQRTAQHSAVTERISRSVVLVGAFRYYVLVKQL